MVTASGTDKLDVIVDWSGIAWGTSVLEYVVKQQAVLKLLKSGWVTVRSSATRVAPSPIIVHSVT